jgi:hypothetical protein
MNELIFTHQGAWDGGSYDLGIELGPRDDSRLRETLRALWSHKDLVGCYRLRDVEPHDQTRIEGQAAAFETPLHGVVRIGTKDPVACRTVVVRFDDGDWIDFCLPLGSLRQAFDVGAFPFEEGADLAWRRAVDEWLCDLGRRVFDAVPFRLGLVGWDGGDLDDASRFHASGVPDERWVGYLVPTGGRLAWFASNRGAPITVNRR